MRKGRPVQACFQSCCNPVDQDREQRIPYAVHGLLCVVIGSYLFDTTSPPKGWFQTNSRHFRQDGSPAAGRVFKSAAASFLLIPLVLGRIGRLAEARTRIAALRAEIGDRTPYAIAQLDSVIGETDSAFLWLRFAVMLRKVGLH